MKKRNIIITITLFILIIILLYVLFFIVSNSKKEISGYDYTNKIFHYGGYVDDTDYQQTYIFMKDGTYYNFISQYDETCTLRSLKGTWKINGEKIDISFEHAIFFDGGDLIETDDMAYFGVRRQNYSLIKMKYNGVTTLDFDLKKGAEGDTYMDYLTINSDTYYPIYEFDNQEKLYKKLEEIYGEVFTMLIDENIEIQKIG